MDPKAWQTALAAHGEGSVTDAELAATYVVTRVAACAGSRLLQGARRPALGTAGRGRFLELLGTTRVSGVSEPVAVALERWSAGSCRVRLLFHVPSPVDVLGWQADGERCVSLLPDGVDTAPHEDGLAFAKHDLCHLAKFVDPEHHTGQVGVFRAVRAAMTSAPWQPFAARFDETFARDLEHVVADMNGSAVFLFAALKMKLKMAVRRRVARELGCEARTSGPLTHAETRAYDDDATTLLRLLGLAGPERDAGLRVSTRRDDEASAVRVLRYFEELGREPACAAR